MKRGTFPEPPIESARLQSAFGRLCRTILMFDQIIEPALRAATLTRPDFDMLLDLYVAEKDGRPACMWDVCQAGSAPLSTAHRRLSAMVVRGFVLRLAQGGDWRRVNVGLSSDAVKFIDGITAELARRSVADGASSPAITVDG